MQKRLFKILSVVLLMAVGLGSFPYGADMRLSISGNEGGLRLEPKKDSPDNGQDQQPFKGEESEEGEEDKKDEEGKEEGKEEEKQEKELSEENQRKHREAFYLLACNPAHYCLFSDCLAQPKNTRFLQKSLLAVFWAKHPPIYLLKKTFRI